MLLDGTAVGVSVCRHVWYACMRVCMHVCMHACLYCMHLFGRECVGVCMRACMLPVSIGIDLVYKDDY